MVRAEEPDAQAAVMACALVLETHLGLSPKAMRMLLWTIADDEDTERPRPPRSSARSRMKAL